MKPTLILGYGNPDREDDGVAWHILNGLARRANLTVTVGQQEDLYSTGQGLDFLFALQLAPEMAETLAGYERVCLVDAHTGAVPEDVHIETLQAQYQTSPFTHHLTGQSVLALTHTLYQKQPETILVSVRGFRFGFSNDLSVETTELARQAEETIWNWVQAGPVE